MSLSTYKMVHTETLFVFSIFELMSRLTDILCCIFDIFFSFIYYYNYNHTISLKQTPLCFFAHFVKYVLMFLSGNVDEESK